MLTGGLGWQMFCTERIVVVPTWFVNVLYIQVKENLHLFIWNYVFRISHVNSNNSCCSVAKSCPTLENPWTRHVRLLCTQARQALRSSTITQNLLKFMSTESLMLSNHLVLCHPFSFCFQSLYGFKFCTVWNFRKATTM